MSTPKRNLRHQVRASRRAAVLNRSRSLATANVRRHRSDNMRTDAEFNRRRPMSAVHEESQPYCGPHRFNLYHPTVQDQLAAGTQLKGRPPTPFVVQRDESLIRPFGGFRVRWRDIEVGRTLSWPTYEDCKRLRELHRYSGLATREEAKLLSEVAP